MRRGRSALARSARRLAVGAVLALTTACAESRTIGPPPAAPHIVEPSLAIPADLDLVVRLDLTRLRAALGVTADAVVEALARGAPASAPDHDTAELGRKLLAHANTAWIGVRPGLPAELTDSVVVLRGDFAELVPDQLGGQPPFGRAQDLGGALRRFERAPSERAAPAVLYVAGTDVIVVGSSAEVDALERGIERAQGDPPLVAPETGLVALSARVDGLRQKLAARAPRFARLTHGLERIEGSGDHDGAHFRFSLDLTFESPEDATRIAALVRELVAVLDKTALAPLAKTRVEPIERSLGLRLELTGAELSTLIDCFRSQC